MFSKGSNEFWFAAHEGRDLLTWRIRYNGIENTATPPGVKRDIESRAVQDAIGHSILCRRTDDPERGGI